MSFPHCIKAFYARHIIADDPYQYETYTTDQLVAAVFIFKNERPPKKIPDVLRNEIRRRINNEALPLDERILLLKTLEHA